MFTEVKTKKIKKIGGHSACSSTCDGDALQHLSNELRGLTEVVMAAVAQNGLALEHPSEKLKNVKEAALTAAVAQNGYALEHPPSN